MRTTLTIDDEIGRQLKQVAAKSGKSFKQVVNETLQAGLRSDPSSRPKKRYEVITASMGVPMPGVNLDKALQLAAELEDEETIRKLEMRK